jgi:hypothetical protein
VSGDAAQVSVQKANAIWITPRMREIVVAEHDDLNLGVQASDFAGRLEPIHHGHSDIHQNDVGFQFGSLDEGFVTVFCLAANFDVVGSEQQQSTNAAPDRLLIVND